MNAHLTDEQLHALLFGASSANDQAPLSTDAGNLNRNHLESCPRCMDEFTALSQALGNFKAAATGFSAALTPATLLTPPAKAGFTLPRLVWAGGLAAALALGTASFSALHHAAPAGNALPASQSNVLEANVLEASSNVPEAQSDDALLKDIDQDLSTAVPPSLQPLSITADASTPSSN